MLFSGCAEGFAQGEGFLVPDLASRIKRRISFGMKVEEEFNDNIFKLKDASGWERITHIKPSINFDFTPNPLLKKRNPVTRLTAGLDMDMRLYQHNKELNRTGLKNRILPSLNFEVEINNRLTVHYGVSSSLEAVSDIDPDARRDRRRDLIESVNQNYGLSYLLGPKTQIFDISYEHTDTFYLSDDYKNRGNRSTDTFSAYTYFGNRRVQPFVGADYSVTTYPERGRNNTDMAKLRFGIKGKFFPKTEGTVSAGYAWADIVRKSDRSDSSANTFIFDIELKHIFHPRFYVTFGMGKDPGTSQYVSSDFDITERVNTTFFYRPPHFNKRLTVSGGVELSSHDHRGYRGDNTSNGSKEDRSEFFLNFGYKIRDRLNMAMEYRHERRDSKRADSGYINNIVTLSLTGGF